MMERDQPEVERELVVNKFQGPTGRGFEGCSSYLSSVAETCIQVSPKNVTSRLYLGSHG